MPADQLITDATALWRANGGPEGEVRSQACAISGNSRVYVLEAVNGGAKAVAKSYFQDGGLKRLEAEYLFLDYAARADIAEVPRVIARDNVKLIGIYQFKNGRKLDRSDIGEGEVLAATDFIRALNDLKHIPLVQKLPNAAEACFSAAEHLNLVGRRLEKLAVIPPTTTADIRASKLMKELDRFWEKLRLHITTHISALDQVFAQQERVISPSDFGFHNALSDKGKITFIDFEYAGWDDIAKLVADFFFQPAVPVNAKFFDTFMDRVTVNIPNKNAVQQRIRLLRPIFGVKWCCIMLNCFLPDMMIRSRFADPGRDHEKHRLAQLTKAENAFQTLVNTSWHT